MVVYKSLPTEQDIIVTVKSFLSTGPAHLSPYTHTQSPKIQSQNGCPAFNIIVSSPSQVQDQKYLLSQMGIADTKIPLYKPFLEMCILNSLQQYVTWIG